MNQVKQTQTGGLIASGTEDAEGPEECYKRTATDQINQSWGIATTLLKGPTIENYEYV